MRNLGSDDLLLNERLIPRNNAVAISNYSAHHDENRWNTGSEDDPHPLDEFWAERFVIYPHDSSSGPLKKRHNQKNQMQMHSQPRPALSTSDIERAPIEHSALSTIQTPASTATDACAAASRFSDDGLA